ncbi:hypothetical protein [Pontibacter cellulosilyticus]|uniref:DUF4398 domain-containing protein n=1 Tax=Pontibacter cellulosilyticus TaxID=1720253 RepID=A0A923SMF7_9BACT|nr:hypothetical protein [Pontibacter cellulosilyticus]MBC5992155.1 hypothetical protein [Pontibacter cellulosilyticus]
MHTITKYSLLSICFLLLLSCNNNEANEESEIAYTEYKDYVTQTEAEANAELSETEMRAMRKSVQDSTLWQTESAELMQEYDTREKRVRNNIDTYDEARRAEIEDLDARYNMAIENRERKYQEVSRRYKLREDLVGLPISADDLTAISATELAPTYTRFVDTLEDRVNEFETNEWNLIEGWWIALNNRKNALEGELSADAKRTIDNATAQYKQIREAELTVEGV